jgi:hypothetical protein
MKPEMKSEMPNVTSDQIETEEDQAVTAALRAKLTAIVALPLTSRSLLMLEQTSRLARELICVGKDAKSLNRKMPYYNGGYSLAEEEMNYPGEPLAPAPKAETFGAQLVREMVAMKNSAPPMTTMEMIGAIALAKEKGLIDIATRLEEKLLTSTDPVKEEPKALPAHSHAHGVETSAS